MAEKKTAAAKAQEALDLATRKRDRTASRLEKAKEVVTEAEALLKIEQAEVDYLAQHPSLKAPLPDEAEAPDVEVKNANPAKADGNPLSFD